MIRWAPAVIVLAVGPVFAAESGGIRAELTVGLGAIADSDPRLLGEDLSTPQGVASLKFTFSSKTRTQKLGLRFEADQVGNYGLRSQVQLSYTRKTKSSVLTFDASSYRLPEGEVTGRSNSSDDGFDLAASQGRQRIHEATTGLKLGVGRPLEVAFSYGVRRREILGAVATRSTKHLLQAGLSMRIGARTQGRVNWEGRKLTTTGATVVSQGRSQLQFGVTHRFDAKTDLMFDAGWQKQSVANVEDQGLEWGASVTRHLKGGRVFAAASLERTATASLRRLQFGIARKSKRGSLDFIAGAAQLKAGSVEPMISLQAEVKFDTGKLELSASRDFFGSDDTGEIRVGTKFDLQYEYRIDGRNAFDISAAYQRTDATALTPSRSEGRLGFSYRRQLHRDLGLVIGLQRRRRNDAVLGRRVSNAAFFTFEKKFSGGL